MHTSEHPNNYYNFKIDLKTCTQIGSTQSLTNPRTRIHTASLHKAIISYSASILYRLHLIERDGKKAHSRQKDTENSLTLWSFDEDVILHLPCVLCTSCVYVFICMQRTSFTAAEVISWHFVSAELFVLGRNDLKEKYQNWQKLQLK